MAGIGATFFDLIDLHKSEGNGSAATVIEMLKENNAILDDAMTVECNMGTSHRTTIRTGLPSVTWGRFYQGIPQSKGTKAQVDDTTGFVEALSTVDERLLDISSNPAAVRLAEAQGFLEAMSQEVAATLIYGNDNTSPEEFTGFAPRFNSLSAANGDMIVDGGGTGSDNTSIWFVTWGDNTAHMLYPSGTAAGVSRNDMGRQRVVDGSGNAYYAQEEMFSQHAGLSVRDWRQVARIANIDSSDLIAGSVDIYALMRKAFWKLKKHRLPGSRFAIYCNSDCLEALDADSTPTTSTITGGTTRESYVRLRPTEVDGFEVMSYRGFPVRQVDAILNTEAQIT
jgi:hypothetical protein